MTAIDGPALRLTIFIGESDRWHHKPLYTEIVHRAHAAGLAGASVLRGIEGYGASSRIHTNRLLSLSEDLPDRGGHRGRGGAGARVPAAAGRAGHRGAGDGRSGRGDPVRRPRPLTVLLVAVGAAVGAPLRYLVDRFIQARHDSLFPWGTLTVNLVGCFVLGALAGAGGLPGWALALVRYRLLRRADHLLDLRVRDGTAGTGAGPADRAGQRRGEPGRRAGRRLPGPGLGRAAGRLIAVPGQPLHEAQESTLRSAPAHLDLVDDQGDDLQPTAGLVERRAGSARSALQAACASMPGPSSVTSMVQASSSKPTCHLVVLRGVGRAGPRWYTPR